MERVLAHPSSNAMTATNALLIRVKMEHVHILLLIVHVTTATHAQKMTCATIAIAMELQSFVTMATHVRKTHAINFPGAYIPHKMDFLAKTAPHAPLLIRVWALPAWVYSLSAVMEIHAPTISAIRKQVSALMCPT